MAIKKFDLVIFGATSFVGQILTEYLFQHIGLSRKIKWAIAGRSETKLNELRDSLGEGAAKLPIIVADSHDRPALDSMCKKSRVIVSTVGPYILYGEELIAWVKLAPDAAPVTAEDLQAFCKGKIAHFKIPKNYKFVDEFPMTVTGKIQKFKMREISIEEMGLKK